MFFRRTLPQSDDKLVPYTTGHVCYKQDNETMEWVVMAQNSDGMCEELSRELCPVCAIVKATKNTRFGITWYYILEEAEEIIEEAEQELWAA